MGGLGEHGTRNEARVQSSGAMLPSTPKSPINSARPVEFEFVRPRGQAGTSVNTFCLDPAYWGTKETRSVIKALSLSPFRPSLTQVKAHPLSLLCPAHQHSLPSQSLLSRPPTNHQAQPTMSSSNSRVPPSLVIPKDTRSAAAGGSVHSPIDSCKEPLIH